MFRNPMIVQWHVRASSLQLARTPPARPLSLSPPLTTPLTAWVFSFCWGIFRFQTVRQGELPNVVCHFKAVPWVTSELELYSSRSRGSSTSKNSSSRGTPCEWGWGNWGNNKVKMKWLGTNDKASIYMPWEGERESEIKQWRLWECKAKSNTHSHTHTNTRSCTLCARTFWQAMKHILIARKRTLNSSQICIFKVIECMWNLWKSELMFNCDTVFLEINKLSKEKCNTKLFDCINNVRKAFVILILINVYFADTFSETNSSVLLIMN